VSPPLRLTLRLDRDGAHLLGPGKIRLLELIGEHGSISRAGREMAMSYRRAWLLVEAINTALREPAVTARPGGAGGGGAALTETGRRLVESYRRLEREAGACPALLELSGLLAATPPDA
jgi:molybdate transport system regulatory protein